MSSCSRPKNCSLYVRNLPRETRSEDLERLFSQYGRVTDVHIPLDPYTGEPREFAYVQFEDIRGAEDANHYLNGETFHRKEIQVQFAEGQRKTPAQMRAKERREAHGYSSSNKRDNYDEGNSRRSRSPGSGGGGGGQ
ncbi:serine/arginine-rich splicing factor 10-like [Porites lutea]|uniref:serine/arginine-rich splicing factor 10-like n=1 Tax=Porites lutea TaxID=51062 RepID=UPI003CC68472